MTLKKTKGTDVDNFNEFMALLGLDEIPATVFIFEKEDHIVVQWNKKESTVFYANGEWKINNSKGLYPSGKGHHIAHIKSTILKQKD